MVIRSNRKSGAVRPAQNEAAFHGLPLPTRLLIDSRRPKPHAAVLAVDNQSPFFQFQFFRTLEFQLGLPRI